MAGNNEKRDKSGGTGDRVFFDAVLHPHRSLSPFGFRLLMVLSAGSLLAVGLLFWAIGAWPVIGFCGLEFLLLYAAFRVNYRAARACERLRLSDDGLEVQRMRPNGTLARVWRVQPNWLRIDIDNPPEHDSQLTLTSHGKRIVVGSSLTPEERLDLARALGEALDRWRSAPHPCGAN
jgi:uncharacterized membrane protein